MAMVWASNSGQVAQCLAAFNFTSSTLFALEVHQIGTCKWYNRLTEKRTGMKKRDRERQRETERETERDRELVISV